MKNTGKYLKNLPRKIQNLINLGQKVAEKKKVKVYLVGGLVRDLILKINNLDLDFMVEGNGIEFGEYLAGELGSDLTRHQRFKTVTLKVKSGLKIDIVSSRKEYYPYPGSLPVVSEGTLKDDLSRRDFTINAMAISINRPNFGTLIDYYNGFRDLKDKEINVLHEASFIDDPTRILRAIRFEQRYGFKIGTATLRYLNQSVSAAMLSKVSAHRLREELILMLKEKVPLKPLMRLKSLCTLKFIHPRLGFSERTADLFNSIKHEIAWVKNHIPKNVLFEEWLIYLMALLGNLSISEINNILSKLSLRKTEAKKILDCLRLKSRIFTYLRRKKVQASEAFGLLDPLGIEAVIFLKAKFKNINFQHQVKDFLLKYQGISLSISGDDLLGLGIVPGPDYQRIFKSILKAKLNGKVKTKEQELKLARRLVA